MKPHEIRILAEKEALDEKLAKLKAFLFSPGSPIFQSLPPEDRDLLEDQYTFMEQYSKVLSKRIARFSKGAI